MKSLIFIALISTSFAVEPKKEEKAPLASLEPVSRSVIVIDPKARAQDFAQAFQALRKDKPTFKIMIQTTAGNLDAVTDVSVLNGGSLLMIQLMTPQGNRLQAVPVEQIMEIQYSP